MSPESDSSPHSTHKSSLLRRAWSLFLIVCIGYTVCDWAKRLNEVTNVSHGVPAPGSMAAAMQASVTERLDQLTHVDAVALMGVLGKTLEENECDWLFQCTSIQHARSRPQLYYHPAGPIVIPTLHTMRGLPQALRRTVGAIWDVGAWAVIMFGSCTVIWAVILIRTAKSADSAWPVYVLVMGAPVWITLMVMLVQWIGEEALQILGAWAVTVLMSFPPSGAITSLILEIPHIVKAPHEVREAAQSIRKP